MTQPAAPDGPPPVGSKLATFRKDQGLTLDQLSRRAGVSKSMLSQIERNAANPTVAILWRLANALGIELTDFLTDGPTGRANAGAIQVVDAHALPTLTSPDGKCTLKILGSIELAGRFEWYELTIQPGGLLSSEPHEQGSREHLSVLGGTLEVSTDLERRKLKSGQTARYAVDVAHAIGNPGKSVASGILVVEHAG